MSGRRVWRGLHSPLGDSLGNYRCENPDCAWRYAHVGVDEELRASTDFWSYHLQNYSGEMK